MIIPILHFNFAVSCFITATRLLRPSTLPPDLRQVYFASSIGWGAMNGLIASVWPSTSNLSTFFRNTGVPLLGAPNTAATATLPPSLPTFSASSSAVLEKLEGRLRPRLAPVVIPPNTCVPLLLHFPAGSDTCLLGSQEKEGLKDLSSILDRRIAHILLSLTLLSTLWIVYYFLEYTLERMYGPLVPRGSRAYKEIFFQDAKVAGTISFDSAIETHRAVELYIPAAHVLPIFVWAVAHPTDLLSGIAALATDILMMAFEIDQATILAGQAPPLPSPSLCESKPALITQDEVSPLVLLTTPPKYLEPCSNCSKQAQHVARLERRQAQEMARREREQAQEIARLEQLRMQEMARFEHQQSQATVALVDATDALNGAANRIHTLEAENAELRRINTTIREENLRMAARVDRVELMLRSLQLE